MSDSTLSETMQVHEAPSATSDAGPELQPFQLDDLSLASQQVPTALAEMSGEVELELRIELGRTRMRLEDVLKLRGGSVVVLDNAADEPVGIYVNDRMIARGEVLTMDDRFCIRITELVGN